MVTYATIQAAINKGLGKAGAALGQSMAWYRPTDAECPAISDLNQIGTITAYLDPSSALNASKPSQYGKPQWYGAFDRTNTLPGDYLVGPQGTYFVASQQDLLPTMLIQCSAVLSITRPSLGYPDHDPSRAYSGAPGNDVPVVTQYPVSLLDKSRGERGPVDLSGDSQKLGSWEVLMPNLPNGTVILVSDRAADQLGNLYAVSAPELTQLGWRILITSENA